MGLCFGFVSVALFGLFEVTCVLVGGCCCGCRWFFGLGCFVVLVFRKACGCGLVVWLVAL